MSDGPSGQLPPVDPALFERAREAVQALRGQGRQSNGQAAPSNTLAMRTGLRSMQLLKQPDVLEWHREQVAAIEMDLGGSDEMSTLARATAREAGRLEVILAALGEELLEHGVLTGKGKTRSATTIYLKTFDRFLKAATTLGLSRRPRRVPTLAEALAALPEDDGDA